MQFQNRISSIGKRPVFRDRKAFTLRELLILVGVLLLLACVVLPCIGNHRRQVKARACIQNLKQIGVGFRTWALDCGDSYPTQVTLNSGGAKERVEMGQVFFTFAVMSNEIGSPRILACPEDVDKVALDAFGPSFSNTNVSYFIGADAQDTFPQMLLIGDRNLAYKGDPIAPGLFVVTSNRSALSWTRSMHNERGHIGLADGSVRDVNSKQLAFAAANQSCDTNRLVIP